MEDGETVWNRRGQRDRNYECKLQEGEEERMNERVETVRVKEEVRGRMLEDKW